MTDDDTKFARSRRERPHIEAFARIVSEPDPELSAQGLRTGVGWAEMLARWSTIDEQTKGSDPAPHDRTSSH